MTYTQKANHKTDPHASTTFARVEPLPYRESLRLLHLRGRSVAGAAYEAGEKYHKAASRFAVCGSSVRLNEWVDNSSGEVKQTFSGGQLCGQRLCPKCQHYKGRILCQQIGKVHGRYLEKEPETAGVLLTLTLKNCSPDALRRTVQHMHHAFGKLRRRIEFETAVTGFFRATEVTINRTEGRTYHPHMHVLLSVPRAYFRKGSGLYIEHERWREIWQECLGVDYRPMVNVQAVTPEAMKKRTGRKGRELDVAGAIREVAKYCVKPDGFQEILPNGRFWTDPTVFQELQDGLRGLRLYAWGGEFDVIRKELELVDVEAMGENLSDEVESVEKPPQNYTLIAKVVYNWDNNARNGWGDYVEIFRRDLTEDIDILNTSRFRGGG